MHIVVYECNWSSSHDKINDIMQDFATFSDLHEKFACRESCISSYIFSILSSHGVHD